MSLELTDFNGLKRLNENEWMAICPCHDDKNGSLHIDLFNRSFEYVSS